MLEEATAMYAAVNDNIVPSLLLLRDELAATYKITDDAPTKSPAWLTETEVEVLLQAA